MPPFKSLMLAGSTALLLSLTPLASHAAEGELNQQLAAARQEGSIWTAFVLNRHLNPFQLDIAVEDGRARLGGRVEGALQRAARPRTQCVRGLGGCRAHKSGDVHATVIFAS
jgi:hypothetical protein